MKANIVEDNNQGEVVVENIPKNKKRDMVRISDIIINQSDTFYEYPEERRIDLIESIRENGMLVPIIINKRDNGTYLVAGYNRLLAAKELRWEEVPVIILENLEEDAAKKIAIETNLHQRSIAEFSHSEKMEVLYTKYQLMCKQGQRNDLNSKFSKIYDGKEESLSRSLNTREELSRYYHLSESVVGRYIKLHDLNVKLLGMLDDGDLNFGTAVQLAFLSEKPQKMVYETLQKPEMTIDEKKAKALRKHEHLGLEVINKVLSYKPVSKSQMVSIKVDKSFYDKYLMVMPKDSVRQLVERLVIEDFKTGSGKDVQRDKQTEPIDVFSIGK